MKSAVYASITSDTQWRFLKLSENIVTMDLMDYPLPPIEEILGIFVWMLENV